MTDREVMQQAIERFIAAYGQTTEDPFGLNNTIAALRAAIAQPKDKP